MHLSILLLSLLSFFVFFSFLFILFRRSSFGIYFIFSISFYLIGLYVVPILKEFNVIDFSLESGILHDSDLGFYAALHSFFFILSIVFFYSITKSSLFKGFIGWSSQFSNEFEKTVMSKLVLVGIATYCLYFYFFGFNRAISSAILIRAGILDEISDVQSYLFLRTVASSFILYGSIIFYFLEEKRKVYIFLYFLLVILIYINSIARGVILEAVVAPVLTYILAEKRGKIFKFSFLIRILLLLFFAMFVAKFGKEFGFFLRNVAMGEHASFLEFVESKDESYFVSFIRNYEFLWNSVVFGIDHFTQQGPYFSLEFFYALFFGWVPVKWLAYFGLDGLNYYNLPFDSRLDCVNTALMGLNACSVPVWSSGYSAYLFPFFGAFFVGGVIGVAIKVLEYFWMEIEKNQKFRLWLPAFLTVSFFHIMTVISTLVSLFVFTGIVILCALFLFLLKKSLLRLKT